MRDAERGDAMRGLGSTGVMDLGGGRVHVLMEHANRGKKSIGLDLSQPEAVDIVYRLAATSDVFLTNKMPSVRRKLHIDVEDIRAHNPSIIYVRGSGYGARGPSADQGGYDHLGFWCRAGCAVGGKPRDYDGIPVQPGPAFGDSLGGMTIAGGIAAALLQRERTGEAPVVDVSLLATGMWAMGSAIALSQQTAAPWEQPPQILTRNPLTGIYRTADDRWVALSCLQGFHYWPEMCRVMGRPELVTDPRFSRSDDLSANGAVASDIVAVELRSRPLAEWTERFIGFKGQWSPVQDSLQVANDPQVEANGYMLETRTKDGVPFQLVTSPVQFDERPVAPNRSPEFHEHGDQILTDELGMDWETLTDLKIKGVVA